jgi:hypothetical protein
VAVEQHDGARQQPGIHGQRIAISFDGDEPFPISPLIVEFCPQLPEANVEKSPSAHPVE